MPNNLDFSCNSPTAVAEFGLSCQTEGEHRQPAQIFHHPWGSLKSCDVLHCTC